MSIIPLPFFFVRVIVPLTIIYASLKSHRSDLSIDVLNLICLLGWYLSSALTGSLYIPFWYDHVFGIPFWYDHVFGIPFLYGTKTILSHQ